MSKTAKLVNKELKKHGINLKFSEIEKRYDKASLELSNLKSSYCGNISHPMLKNKEENISDAERRIEKYKEYIDLAQKIESRIVKEMNQGMHYLN